MKLLFLDIDGVLCTTAEYHKKYFNDAFKKYKDEEEKFKTLYSFSPACVTQLNRIIDETGCEIVISSDCRTFYIKEQLSTIFEANGIDYNITINTEPPASGMYMSNSGYREKRQFEINEYIDVVKPEKWCAVDDMPLH